MADAADARSPLSPVGHGGNVAGRPPPGVRPSGKGYQARVWVPGRGWVGIKTCLTMKEAAAIHEAAVKKILAEGVAWIPHPRPRKLRASGAVCTSPYPARPRTTDMSLSSSADCCRSTLCWSTSFSCDADTPRWHGHWAEEVQAPAAFGSEGDAGGGGGGGGGIDERAGGCVALIHPAAGTAFTTAAFQSARGLAQRPHACAATEGLG